MVFKLSTHAPKNLCVIELSGFKKNLKAVTTLRKLMPVERFMLMILRQQKKRICNLRKI